MEENGFIKIERISRKKENVVEYVKREDFLTLMISVRDNYINNNQVSTKLVEYIPDLREITIDEDRNKELDIPFVMLVMNNGTTTAFRIPRWHNIIWSILNGYLKA